MKKYIIFIQIFLIFSSGCSLVYKHVINKRNEKYREGIRFYNRKDYKKAKDRFDTVVSIDPEYKRAKYYLRKTDNYLRRKKQRINKIYNRGLYYKKRKKYETALNNFLIVEKVDPGFKDVNSQIEQCREKLTGRYKWRISAAKKLYKKGKYIDAYEYCKRARKYKPEGYEVKSLIEKINDKLGIKTKKYRKRADYFYSKSRYKKAVENLKIVLKIHPWDRGSRKILADCNRKIEFNEKYNSAVKNYKKKKYYLAYIQFSYIKKREESYKATDRYLDKLKKILVKYIGRYYNRGMSYYEKDKFKAAINEWNKVLMINPNHSKALKYKRRAQEKLEIKESL